MHRGSDGAAHEQGRASNYIPPLQKFCTTEKESAGIIFAIKEASALFRLSEISHSDRSQPTYLAQEQCRK